MVGRRFATLVIAAALFLGACTGGGSSGGSGKPRSGGVLRVGVTADANLDPAQARTVEQLLVADQLFDGLTAFDPKTKKLIPSISAQWSASPDQKQWDFALRRDAVFSNGRRVTATDVKYTLDRIAGRGSGSPGAELLEPVVGYTDVAVKGNAPSLVGVSAPSPDLVHIDLDQPFAALPVVLSSPVFGIVPKEAVEAQSPVFAKEPVGSGPFQVKERTNERIRLLKSPNSRALLAGIDLVGYDGVAASYTAFTRGELDWSQVPPEQVAAANRTYGNSGFVPYAAELLFGINLKNDKFKDARFREAIVRAVDRHALVTAVYDNIYKPLDGIVVSGIPGFVENACGDQCGYDVGKSRELVAAVFPQGPPQIFLDYDAGPIRDALAKAIQADLKEVGVDAQLRPKPFNDYLNFEVSGQQELFLLGWIAAYPSQEAFLGPLLSAKSRNNLVGFNVPDFEGALSVARAQPDDTQREELYRQAEKTALGQVPLIPILQYEVHSVTSKRVRGLNLSPTGTFDGAVVWLSR